MEHGGVEVAGQRIEFLDDHDEDRSQNRIESNHRLTRETPRCSTVAAVAIRLVERSRRSTWIGALGRERRCTVPPEVQSGEKKNYNYRGEEGPFIFSTIDTTILQINSTEPRDETRDEE